MCAGNSDPPKNYTEWGELIGALGQHLVDKYGEKVASEMYFEARAPASTVQVKQPD